MMKIKYTLISILLTFLLLGCSSDENNTPSTDTENSKFERVAEVIPDNWYLRLSAEDRSRELKTESSQLGELLDAEKAQSSALKAIGTSSESFIDIVFENPDGLESGLYKAVFFGKDDQEKSWKFNVVTDDETADITLTWHGVFVLNPREDDASRFSSYRSVTNPIIARMKLVDLETLEKVQAVRDGHIMKYKFNMNNSTSYAFEWVVSTQDVNITLPPVPDKDSISVTASASVQHSSSASSTEARSVKPKAFGFGKPTTPIFK